MLDPFLLRQPLQGDVPRAGAAPYQDIVIRRVISLAT
jgi:hypothetical protein